MTEVHNKPEEINETKNLVLCLNCYNQAISRSKETAKSGHVGLPAFDALFKNKEDQLEHVESCHNGATDVEFISVWDKKEGANGGIVSQGTNNRPHGPALGSTPPVNLSVGGPPTHQSVSAANANYNLHYYQSYPIQSYHGYYSSSSYGYNTSYSTTHDTQTVPMAPSATQGGNGIPKNGTENGTGMNQNEPVSNQAVSYSDYGYHNQNAYQISQNTQPPTQNPTLSSLPGFGNENKDDQRYNSIVFASEF